MQYTVGTARLAGLLATAALLAAPAIGAADTIKGMITSRDGANMTVTGNDGTATVVTLTDYTTVRATAGALGLQSRDLAVTDLIAGLPVTVDTHHNGAQTEAVRVTFKSGDLKTAQQVEAGTATIKAENEKLKERLSNANQYVLKGEATVYFATGSAAISEQGKADLRSIAGKATGIKGYMIGVTGHADTTGDPDANQALSEKRADAVVHYLRKCCEIQPYRVMTGQAMGEDRQVGSDTQSAQGKAQNRRVVVQILTNKGLEGA